ncbi:MAG TPA: hypothetical protein DDX54_06395 [Rhodospirillaceae bacterium]|nr:hypothetical protein [Rhodospirillaceae bacterium]
MRHLVLMLLLFAAPAFAGPLYIARPADTGQEAQRSAAPYIRPGAQPLISRGASAPRVYTQYHQAKRAVQANPGNAPARRRMDLLAHAARAAEDAQRRVDTLNAMRAQAQAQQPAQQRPGTRPMAYDPATVSAQGVYIAPQQRPRAPPTLFGRQN